MIQSALHVAINVTNLSAAEHFYGTLLGLSKIDRILKFPGAWYQVGDFQIHLIVREQAVSLPDSQAKWGRYPHLALAVAQLDQMKQTLMAAGVPLQPSASGRAALFVQDPDGNVIELSQQA